MSQDVFREAICSDCSAELRPERLERVCPRRVTRILFLVARDEVLVELGHVVQDVEAQQLLGHFKTRVLQLLVYQEQLLHVLVNAV